MAKSGDNPVGPQGEVIRGAKLRRADQIPVIDGNSGNMKKRPRNEYGKTSPDERFRGDWLD